MHFRSDEPSIRGRTLQTPTPESAIGTLDGNRTHVIKLVEMDAA